MLEPLIYGAALACFFSTIMATARIPESVLLMACIPPVFVSIVMGFVMAVYAWDSFGIGLPAAALIPGVAVAWQLPKHYKPRDQVIAVYLLWAVGLVFASVGVTLPDPE